MNEPRRILILTLSFGSGHMRAAQVVARELHRQAPDAEVRVVDALEDSRLLFRAAYVWPYWAMIRYAPQLWARFFAARTKRRDTQTAPAWAFRYGCAKVFDFIAEFKPDTIVATEVAAGEIAALAKKSGLTGARIISVITDHEAEPVWVSREVETYFVPDEKVAAQLQTWGAQPASMRVCGIPIDATFNATKDAQALRASYGFSDNAPLVLLMGGGMGPTRMDQVASRLAAYKMPLHIMAVTGHDAKVQRRLLRLRVEEPATLNVLGWTDDVAALMRGADVLVTKPGGLTIAEAAACHLPTVLFDAIPGPEQRNAERLVDAGAAILTKGAEETATAVMLLLRDERLRYAMSTRAGDLACPMAATEIAQYVLDSKAAATKDIGERRRAMA